MLRHLLFSIVLFVFSLPAQSDSLQLLVGFGDEAGNPQTVIDELSVSCQQRLTLNRRLGSGYILDVEGVADETQRVKLLELLRNDPRILYAEQPPRLRAKFTPNELASSDQWYLTDSYGIDAPAAWDVTRGSNSVRIALLDTGILPHEDLKPSRMLPGYDFVSDSTYSNDGDGRDADPTDPGDAVTAGECGFGEPAYDSSWHGLQVTGVVAATADNGIGIAGIDHRARLLPVRVLGKCGGDFIDVLEAMRWAAGLSVTGVPINPNPVDVINMSFSGSGACSSPIQSVIDEVVAQGVVVVAAAGNENTNVNDQVPANCRNVIAVAGTDRSGDRAYYSNFGTAVAIAAPGGAGSYLIRTISNQGATAPAGDAYVGVIGTSFSAAMVTGGAALLRALNPGLTPDEVLFYLQQGSQPFPAGSTCNTVNCGAGILNLAQSVQTASSATSAATQASSDGGGGGGCAMTTGKQSPIDPVWIILATVACLRMLRQRRMRVNGHAG